MIERLVRFSLHNRLLVIVLAIAVFAAGTFALIQTPVDAFPDTTPVQVQINTTAPALNPAEVEQQITSMNSKRLLNSHLAFKHHHQYIF